MQLYSKESKIYDKTSLFHKNHITDGRHGSWNGIVNNLFIKEIEIKYKNWFVENGYDI
jgi:hypothetical protein